MQQEMKLKLEEQKKIQEQTYENLVQANSAYLETASENEKIKQELEN
jgi:hypothetical protein